MRRKSIPPFAALFALSSAMAASAGKFSATIDGVKIAGAGFDTSFVQNRAEILSIHAFLRYSAHSMKIVVDSITAARAGLQTTYNPNNQKIITVTDGGIGLPPQGATK